MSYPKQIPAQFRYFLARLQPFMRPAFWVSTVGLLLLALLAWEYSNVKMRGNNQLAEAEQPKFDPNSAKEIAAMGADIDSSEVLSKEFDLTNSSSLTTLPNQPSVSPSSDDFLTQLPPPVPVVDFKPDSSSAIAPFKPQQRSNFGTPFSTSSRLDILNQGSLARSSSSANRKAIDKELFSPTAGTTTNSASELGSSDSLKANKGVATTSPLPNAPTATSPLPNAPAPRTTTNSSPTAANRVSRPAERGIPTLPTPSAPELIPPPILPEVTGYNTSGQNTNPSLSETPLGASSLGTPGQQNTNSPTTPPSATGFGTNPSASTISPDSLFAPEPSLPLTNVSSPAPAIPNSAGQNPIQSPSQTNGVIPSSASPIPNAVPNSVQGTGIQPSQLSQPNFGVPVR